MFFVLDGERRSLTAELRPSWRLRRRYEDLSLVMMLAHLERDWLSQPGPHLEGGYDPKGHGDGSGHRLADWAKPWGAAPRMKLDADIGHVDGALKRLRRWLSRRTVAKAGGRARERLEAITTELEERDPRARAAAAAAAQGAVAKALGFDRPTRTRATAIAGLFLLAAGAGAFLLASPTGSGPGDVGRRGAVAGVRQHPGALEAQVQKGSGRRGRGAGQSAGPPGRQRAQGSIRATSQRTGQSAPAATEIAPPAPEPAPVAQSAPAPAPAPAPPSSPSSQAKSAAGGGDCPPEFGYEC